MTIHVLGREISVNKPVLAVIIAAAVIIAGAAGYILTNSGRDIIIESDGTQESGISNEKITVPSTVEERTKTKKTDLKDEDNESSDNSTTAEAGEIFEDTGGEHIKVYVVGCVKKPGVISLAKGQLIDDAIRSAGGLTAEADPTSINMVYELQENVMLVIQSKKELSKGESPSNAAVQTGGKEPAAGKGVKVVTDSGSARILGQEAAVPASAETGKGKINLNTATAAELDTLPGIGEATAADIISYRESNGPFQKTSDIMKVPRIKESRYNAIKELITVN